MGPLLQHFKPCSYLCCAGRGGSHRRRAGLAGGRVCCLGALPTLPAAVHVYSGASAVLLAATRAGAHPPPTPATLPPPRPPLLQANEQRFRLLEGKHTTLVAEKDKLFQENETLRQVSRRGADLATRIGGEPAATTVITPHVPPLTPAATDRLCRSSRLHAWSAAGCRRR
jgi:hypothetical protein